MVPRASLSRRQLIQGGCALVSLGAWSVRATDHPLATREIAAGVHVRRGVDEDASVGNDDAIANIGFIVGRESVAVIDPGGSLRDGERLRARIREVTVLPIRFVIMTHAHPDHIFGAGAFQGDQPTFVGHARMPQSMAERGEYYQRRLNEILGAGRCGSGGGADPYGRRDRSAGSWRAAADAVGARGCAFGLRSQHRRYDQWHAAGRATLCSHAAYRPWTETSKAGSASSPR